MNKKSAPLLEVFLSYFPEIEPPILLSQEIVHRFSEQNKPLPQKLIEEVFSQWENLDEYSELVPCCSLKDEGKFHIIIYWKASLLKHEYKVATLDQKCQLISLKVIGGLNVINNSTLESVASIDEDLCIYTVVGKVDSKINQNTSEKQAWKFQILPDGQIYSEKEKLN